MEEYLKIFNQTVKTLRNANWIVESWTSSNSHNSDEEIGKQKLLIDKQIMQKTGELFSRGADSTEVINTIGGILTLSTGLNAVVTGMGLYQIDKTLKLGFDKLDNSIMDLRKSIDEGFNKLDSTLKEGFFQIDTTLQIGFTELIKRQELEIQVSKKILELTAAPLKVKIEEKKIYAIERYNRGEYEFSLEKFLNLHDEAEEIGLIDYLIPKYIATIYFKYLGQPEESIKWFKKSIKYSQREEKNETATSYVILADAYYTCHLLDKNKQQKHLYINKAISSIEKVINFAQKENLLTDELDYQKALYLSSSDNVNQSSHIIKKLISKNPFYFVKVLTESGFRRIKEELGVVSTDLFKDNNEKIALYEGRSLEKVWLIRKNKIKEKISSTIRLDYSEHSERIAQYVTHKFSEILTSRDDYGFDVTFIMLQGKIFQYTYALKASVLQIALRIIKSFFEETQKKLIKSIEDIKLTPNKEIDDFYYRVEDIITSPNKSSSIEDYLSEKEISLRHEFMSVIDTESLSSISGRRVENALFNASYDLLSAIERAIREILFDEFIRPLKYELRRERELAYWILKSELTPILELRREFTRSDDYVRIHLLKLYYDKVFMDFDNSYGKIYSNFVTMLKESKLKEYNA